MAISSRSVLILASTLLLILGVMFSGCTSAISPAPAPVTQQQAPVEGTNTVTIQNFAFNPATLPVSAGTTVTWINKDSATHEIASDSGTPIPFSSKGLPDGASYQFTFTSPGTYSYHCAIHPSMKAKVVVT